MSNLLERCTMSLFRRHVGGTHAPTANGGPADRVTLDTRCNDPGSAHPRRTTSNSTAAIVESMSAEFVTRRSGQMADRRQTATENGCVSSRSAVRKSHSMHNSAMASRDHAPVTSLVQYQPQNRHCGHHGNDDGVRLRVNGGGCHGDGCHGDNAHLQQRVTTSPQHSGRHHGVSLAFYENTT